MQNHPKPHPGTANPQGAEISVMKYWAGPKLSPFINAPLKKKKKRLLPEITGKETNRRESSDHPSSCIAIMDFTRQKVLKGHKYVGASVVRRLAACPRTLGARCAISNSLHVDS